MPCVSSAITNPRAVSPIHHPAGLELHRRSGPGRGVAGRRDARLPSALRALVIDAFVNASMILSGMGPLAAPETTVAKLFAGLHALFSGLAVLAIAGVIFAPAIHRFLHYLHADPGDR